MLNQEILQAQLFESDSQGLKNDAMEKMLKTAPKHMRALLETGGW